MIKQSKIKTAINKLPKKPGVYIFRDSNKRIIYIGKALSLKNRVSSYFQKNITDQKTQELVENIADLRTILVNSEFEALLLEAQLIKQYRPKYNSSLKDDKSYLYIVIGKEFPNRIYPSRRPEIESKLLAWYGPFPSSKDVREILRIVRRIFPFRSCRKLPQSTCLYYHLKLCPGVCVTPFVIPTKSRRTSGRVEESLDGVYPERSRRAWDDEYPKTILSIRQMFSGKTTALIKNLEIEMKKLAKENKFEEAQKIKSKIDILKRVTQGWKDTPCEYQESAKSLQEIKDILIKYGRINLLTINKIEGYDVSNLSSQIIVGSLVAFVNGEPEKSSYRKFNLKGYFNFRNRNLYDHQNDPEGIRQILSRRLGHPEWILPQVILIDGGKTQVGAAFSALKEKALENQIAIIGLTKEEEILVIPQLKGVSVRSWKRLKLPRNSLALKLLQQIRDESHRFAQRYYQQLHLKTISK